jgi:hypothetical protein
MIEYSKTIKIYLFKDKKTVSISFLVSPSLVNQYTLLQNEFENIINNFNNTVEFETSKGTYWYIERKEYGPRPDKIYSPYIRVSVSTHGLNSHYRFTIEEFSKMISDYKYQKNNKMYWD